jgi:hypothetical protein
MKHNSYFLENFAIYNMVSILMLMNMIFLKMDFMVFIDVIMMMSMVFITSIKMIHCDLFSFLLDMKLAIQSFYHAFINL